MPALALAVLPVVDRHHEGLVLAHALAQGRPGPVGAVEGRKVHADDALVPEQVGQFLLDKGLLPEADAPVLVAVGLQASQFGQGGHGLGRKPGRLQHGHHGAVLSANAFGPVGAVPVQLRVNVLGDEAAGVGVGAAVRAAGRAVLAHHNLGRPELEKRGPAHHDPGLQAPQEPELVVQPVVLGRPRLGRVAVRVERRRRQAVGIVDHRGLLVLQPDGLVRGKLVELDLVVVVVLVNDVDLLARPPPKAHD